MGKNNMNLLLASIFCALLLLIEGKPSSDGIAIADAIENVSVEDQAYNVSGENEKDHILHRSKRSFYDPAVNWVKNLLGMKVTTKCYQCGSWNSGQSCSQVIVQNCEPDQNYCYKADFRLDVSLLLVNFKSDPYHAKGCMLKEDEHYCEESQKTWLTKINATCCQGDLCNSGSSLKGNLLFLFLIFVFIMIMF